MNNTKFLDELGLSHLMSKLKKELNKRATLGDDGKVPSDQLPSYVDDVVEFNGMVEGITIMTASTTNPGFVVYDKTSKTFVLAVSGMTQGSATYYGNWTDRENFGVSGHPRLVARNNYE